MPAIAQASVGMTWLLDPTPPRYAMSGFHSEMDEAMYPAAIDTYWHSAYNLSAGFNPYIAPHPPLKKFTPISKLFLIWV